MRDVLQVIKGLKTGLDLSEATNNYGPLRVFVAVTSIETKCPFCLVVKVSVALVLAWPYRLNH